MARVDDIGPVLLGRLRQVLGDRCQILLKPVIDLNDTPAPVDAYEIPEDRRTPPAPPTQSTCSPTPPAVAAAPTSTTPPHISPTTGGPPGQTAVGNLGPLVRHHHRVKTHGGWHVRQPEAGSWIWRAPTGRIYLVNTSGTHPLGKSAFAQQIWRAANSPPEPTERSPVEEVVRTFLDAYTLIG